MTWLTGIPSGWKKCAIGLNDCTFLDIVHNTLIAHSKVQDARKDIQFKRFDLSLSLSSDSNEAEGTRTIIQGRNTVIPNRPSQGYAIVLQDPLPHPFQHDPTTFFYLNDKKDDQEGFELNIVKAPLAAGRNSKPSDANQDVEFLRTRTFPNDKLYTREMDRSNEIVEPSALGSLVAFTLELGKEESDPIHSQIVIWDYVADEILVKIPLMVTSSYSQAEDKHADPDGLMLPYWDSDEGSEPESQCICDCRSIRLLSSSRILVTGRNEFIKLGYGHDQQSMSNAYIYSFSQDQWTLDKIMRGACDQQDVLSGDDITGTLIHQADIQIEKDERTTIQLLGIVGAVLQDCWQDSIRIVDEDRYLNKLGNRARGFHSEYPRCLGDYEFLDEESVGYIPRFDCPYIAGWRALCGSGHAPKLSANADGEPAAGMRWTDILYYDFCPGLATKVQALPDSIKSHIRVHIQQAPYDPVMGERSVEYDSDDMNRNDRYTGEVQVNDRFAEKGTGITVNEQDAQASEGESETEVTALTLPFLQIRVQTFSDMPNLDVKSVAIWQGGLLLLGEKESLVLYFDEN